MAGNQNKLVFKFTDAEFRILQKNTPKYFHLFRLPPINNLVWDSYINKNCNTLFLCSYQNTFICQLRCSLPDQYLRKASEQLESIWGQGKKQIVWKGNTLRFRCEKMNLFLCHTQCSLVPGILISSRPINTPGKCWLLFVKFSTFRSISVSSMWMDQFSSVNTLFLQRNYNEMHEVHFLAYDPILTLTLTLDWYLGWTSSVFSNFLTAYFRESSWVILLDGREWLWKDHFSYYHAENSKGVLVWKPRIYTF